MSLIHNWCQGDFSLYNMLSFHYLSTQPAVEKWFTLPWLELKFKSHAHALTT